MVLIPARGGSTRIPGKNLRTLSGRPLLSYVIEAARQADCARVIVSTDCGEIAETARKFGAEVPFLRPASLATAHSSSLSAILHALQALQQAGERPLGFLAFCPPTNPFIRPETISRMFERLESEAAFNSIVTITRPQTHPFRLIRRNEDGSVTNGIFSIEGFTVNEIERSQDWPEVWEGSPACRLTRTAYFLDLLRKAGSPKSAQGKTYDPSHCLGFEIPSSEAFDIDTEDDFALAEWFLERRATAANQ